MLRSSLTCLLLLASVSELQARPVLKGASPAPGAAVYNAPSQISLSFSEALVPSGTDAVVREAGGGVVSSGKARVAAREGQIKVSVKRLVPGKYRVEWYATSAGDRHAQGSYSFVVGAEQERKGGVHHVRKSKR